MIGLLRPIYPRERPKTPVKTPEPTTENKYGGFSFKPDDFKFKESSLATYPLVMLLSNLFIMNES